MVTADLVLLSSWYRVMEDRRNGPPTPLLFRPNRICSGVRGVVSGVMGVMGVTEVEPHAGERIPDVSASYFLKTSLKNDETLADWEAGAGAAAAATAGLYEGRRVLIPFIGGGEPLRDGGMK